MIKSFQTLLSVSVVLLVTSVAIDSGFSAPLSDKVTVVFSPNNWPEQLTGDIYQVSGTESGPAIILIHGGGWAGRSRKDMKRLAQKLVKAGYNVFNINYRLAPEHLYPAQIHDVQIAARWLRKNALKYHIDPNRIGAWGYSSGAHLASMLGVLKKGDKLDSPYGGSESRIKAVVCGGTPTDLTKFSQSSILNEFIGDYYADAPAKYREASPIFYVDRNTAPFHLYHAENDDLVPVSQAQQMADALKSARVPYELKTYRVFGHNTQFLFGNAAVNAAIEFLDARL